MRKCRYCKSELPKKSASTIWQAAGFCGIDCMAAHGVALARKQLDRQREKERKAAGAVTRAKKEAMKTIPQLIAEADKEFCAYIRARDEGKPCICCGRMSIGAGWSTGGEWDAGHYRSRGAASHLRYDERNCHRQLKQCNRRAYDVAGYRANLIDRIGVAEVDALESDSHPHKWGRDELREIRDKYRRMARELRRNGIGAP